MHTRIRLYMNQARKHAAALFALSGLGLILGGVAAFLIPPSYESLARLVVSPQRVSEELVTPTVQMNALEEVLFLQANLLTRETLIEIATAHEVFDELAEMPDEEIMARMRAATTIEASGGPARHGVVEPVLVSIEFEAVSPEAAQAVVSEYVRKMLAANTELRNNVADETRHFFEQEVDRLWTLVAERSSAISSFQQEQAEALPIDQPFRIQRLSMIQEQLAATERDLRDALSASARLASAANTPNVISITADTHPELAELSRQLTEARAVFAATSPQVQLLERRIAAFQSVMSEVRTGTIGEAGSAGSFLDLQRAETEARIETLSIEVERLSAESAALQQAIRQSQRNAITLASLERQLEAASRDHEQAVARLADAAIGARIEGAEQGRRVALLEPASLPELPSNMSRWIAVVAGLTTGLAAAFAYFCLMELLNQKVRAPLDLQSRLAVTPFATIPSLDRSKSSATLSLWRRSAIAPT